MAAQAKSALFSMTVWGGLLALLPELIQGLNDLAGSGVLGEKASGVLHVVGGALAIVGRFIAKVPVKLL